MTGTPPSLHAVDIIRKKRDGHPLTTAEIQFMVAGAVALGAGDDGSLTVDEAQLAAWLMAAFIRGFTSEELQALTTAMRDSGEQLAFVTSGSRMVDKHSTGGVGDKTSLLIAPIVAAAGLRVPMISGRGLGHTGGTLDKLESIPGFRTQLSLPEMERLLATIGACMVGQSPALVPADRVLYALRDHIGAVENPYLICASIMSKKLAEGLHALVLDVKTGSGAFLKDRSAARELAQLMVETGERAGTRTVALLTNMDQPLGRFCGNWVEVQESVELLQGDRNPLSEDLRELSLILAGWMIFLGGKAESAEAGRQAAEAALTSGEALKTFRNMVEAQGGDITVFDNLQSFHRPGARRVLHADRAGYISGMDCEAIGWAVQRLGAGRERAGEPVAAHAGVEMHVKCGAVVRVGDPLFTLFADEEGRLAEPEHLLRQAIRITDDPGPDQQLVFEVVTADMIAATTPAGVSVP